MFTCCTLYFFVCAHNVCASVAATVWRMAAVRRSGPRLHRRWWSSPSLSLLSGRSRRSSWFCYCRRSAVLPLSVSVPCAVCALSTTWYRVPYTVWSSSDSLSLLHCVWMDIQNKRAERRTHNISSPQQILHSAAHIKWFTKQNCSTINNTKTNPMQLHSLFGPNVSSIKIKDW